MAGALVILICVICLKTSEGFETVPDYCGTAGYTMSPGFWKAIGIKPTDAGRSYTESECAKIDGATYSNGTCSLVQDGKQVNLSLTCKGLNKIPSLPPAECSVDGKLVGITNKEITLKDGGKNITFPENSFRFYTSSDCDKLGGKHHMSWLVKMSETERKDFIAKHGKGYGLCLLNEINYTFMCYAEPASAVDVKNKLMSLF
jgi:hypothetical protein